ncbi:precorrin-3B synthase [Commensalibacter nepenthis]|uniref:Precorrin-3B synthase n=1 Tax=Commensalibacter nepenthis TaxID=3043872 RepID=A0ABT6Q764_9PROT|nr:precorrin-3B synthase [Commensalibacter sp. TBRC 10068]MDI2112612.1 precorrin-3B synthase [Commensalibacter sp. TBRC 10068]
MNAIRRGWCPSLFKPMETGDGFLCRIKPFFSSITSDQARFIAELSQQYGNGYSNLSQKGNLQLRGFIRETIDVVVPQVIQAQLGSDDAMMEEKRNIMISPLWDIDPLHHSEVYKIAYELQTALQDHQDIHPLTAKFSFLIDGGEYYGLQDLYADVNIRFYPPYWIIQLGRDKQVIVCNRQDLVKIAVDIIRFCMDHQLKRLLNLENARRYLQHVVYPTVEYINPPSPKRLPIGYIELPMAPIVHIGVPFGLLKASQILHLADISDRFGNGTIRFTPWRSIILPHCSQEGLSILSEFIVTEDDPRLYMSVCPGKPLCSQGQQETMEDASLLLPVWKNQTKMLHVSGCAKGCASPQINAVALCGTAKGYHLILNGKADYETPYQNLKLTEIINLLQTGFLSSH